MTCVWLFEFVVVGDGAVFFLLLLLLLLNKAKQSQTALDHQVKNALIVSISSTRVMSRFSYAGFSSAIINRHGEKNRTFVSNKWQKQDHKT